MSKKRDNLLTLATSLKQTGMDKQQIESILQGSGNESLDIKWVLSKLFPAPTTTAYPVLLESAGGGFYPDPKSYENFKAFCKINQITFFKILNNKMIRYQDGTEKYLDEGVLCRLEMTQRDDIYKPSGEDIIKSIKSMLAEDDGVGYFRDKLNEVTWDGNDRVRELYETLKPADINNPFQFIGFKKWLHGLVAQSLNHKIDKDPSNQIVLILVGPEGIGKSSWATRLLPESPVSLVHEGPIYNNKDTNIRSAQVLVWIASEFESSLSRNEIGSLKDILTKGYFNERAAYDRTDTQYRRVCSFIGSTNAKYFLPAGEELRRFFVLDCSSVGRLDYLHSIDILQLWKQIVTERENGFQNWWSEQEQKENTLRNQRWVIRSSVEDWAEEKIKKTVGYYLPAREAYNKYAMWCRHNQLIPVSPATFYNQLSMLGICRGVNPEIHPTRLFLNCQETKVRDLKLTAREDL